MRAMRPAHVVLVLFAVWLTACERTNPVGPTPSSTNALVGALQAQGATVMRGASLPRESHPYFSVNGQLLVVNNGDVTVFEYSSGAALENDAAKIAPGGTPIGNTQITWMGPPSFYKNGQIMVLYVGSDDAVLRPLESVLGRPFAHR